MAKTIKGIQTANEFSLRKKAYLDDREEFDTLADMAGFDDVPDGFITLNKENGKRYEYNSSNTIDTDLGKWREYKSGGTGGTTNYNALLNKPSINGVDLVGNKTLADLGITNYNDTQVKKDISDLQNNKVDKVAGKSLVDDTEITRLAGINNYDDTQVKSDIADLQSDKQDKTDNSLDTTDKTVVGAINTINGNQLDTVTFSADYKNIILNRKNGLNPYVIPIASIIHNAKIIELNDIDSTNIGDGKTLVYDGTTKKHKYVDSTGTDELVKMDSTTDAKHLSELIDKNTVVNDNGVLKVKKLDGQQVTIAEINHLKGLAMNVMDLVNMFANGGVKIINTPVSTYADLLAYDKTGLIDGISYLVYVLADETHDNAKTTYLIDKTSSTPTYFGNADSQRNFTTNPINLASEVTGKLGASNIDVDSLWNLLTINDTYKTLTANDEVFGTHGAKAMYDELVADIGKKANATDLTTHTSDTDIHVTTADKEKWNKVTDKVDTADFNTHKNDTDIHITSAERTKWNEVDNKVKKTDIVDNLTSTDTDKPLSANQGKVLKGEVDLKANDDEVVKKTDITTTIDSTSTDSEIATAKAVYDNSLTKGIGEGNTIIPDGADLNDYLTPGVYTCFSSVSAETLLNCPHKQSNFKLFVNKNTGETTGFYGYQMIVGSEFSTIFKPCVYYRSVSGDKSNPTYSKWQRLCTTSVADVPVTNIAPADTATFINFAGNSSCNYYVKNGVCYVSLWGVKIASTGATKQTGVILPKCANKGAGVLLSGNGVATAHAFAFIIDTGELCFDVKDANISLFGSFSYPVSES